MVTEWCEDWFDGEFYARSPRADPVNRTPGPWKVVRGGSWAWQGFPATWRYNLVPLYCSDEIGFRIARSAK